MSDRGLRPFVPADGDTLLTHNQAATHEEAEQFIRHWSQKQIDGRYFEMLAVICNGQPVGMISIWERSRHIVSIGPEIFEPYRRQGLGRWAFDACLAYAKERGYTMVVQQIRTDNFASLALHESLGFETDGNILRNRHGNPVFIYVKIL